MDLNFSNYLINNGVEELKVFMLLALPFAALLVSFIRQFIGIKAFSIYEPLVLSYSLFYLAPDFATGLKYGLPIIALAWFVSELTRRLLDQTRLHYISKVSIKISLASIAMLGALSFAAYFGKAGFYSINMLAVIIILTMIESVNLFRVKKGDTATNIISLETLVITFLCYSLLSSKGFENLLLNHSYLVLLAVLGEIIVGRWKGLRLSEYIRFRDVFKND